MRLGVLSDSHNYLEPRIAELFAGVEHILHAGDIGSSVLLAELRAIAPVTAVGGNTDDPGFGYPNTAQVELAGHKILLEHILNPHSLTPPQRERIAQAQPSAVIFGHTHKPFCATLNGILFLNPGYTGKSRFGLPRSLALLDLLEDQLQVTSVAL